MNLNDKRILVTGVSRASGIGAAIALTLAENGAEVIITGMSAYDAHINYPDTDATFTQTYAQSLSDKGLKVKALPSKDLSIAENGIQLIQNASPINGLVLNHAYSENKNLEDWTQEHIDKHLSTNVSGAMMMIQTFAKQLPQNQRGAITLFTSGQYKGSMINEIAYAVSKEAIIAITQQCAAALAHQNIQVNAINPGPTDTGYASKEDYEALKKRFPQNRWGLPSDAAKLTHFLQSDYASWISGEVIASEGGFKR